MRRTRRGPHHSQDTSQFPSLQKAAVKKANQRDSLTAKTEKQRSNKQRKDRKEGGRKKKGQKKNRTVEKKSESSLLRTPEKGNGTNQSGGVRKTGTADVKNT